MRRARLIMVAWVVIALMPALAACDSASQVSIVSADNSTRGTVKVEIADKPDTRELGLMYREHLDDNAGMLFIFPAPTTAQFWMKNTMIPLDMVWMDGGGKVLFISAQTPPCKADPCPSYGPNSPAAMVLEIAGGKAAREKVVVGSVLAFKDVK